MDAFIGIDIDIEPPDTTRNKARQSSSKAPSASSSKNNGTSRKRPRPSPTTAAAASADTARKRPNKPNPPPNPPTSLVSLLHKDASVRSYFQSLQENLDYDVDKWKHEAARWKRLAASSSQEPKKNGSSNGGAVGKKKQSKPKKRATKTKSIPSTLEQKNDQEGTTIPITDEALFGDISDDSSHCSSTQENVPRDDAKSSLSIERKNEVAAEIKIIKNVRHSHILEKLKEAKRCLDMLGVSLVEVEVKSTVTKHLKEDTELGKEVSNVNGPVESHAHEKELEDDTNENGDRITEIASSTVIERILHRQSDEDVAGDMMASFKTFIKTSLLMGSLSETNSAPAKNDGRPDDNQDKVPLLQGVAENPQLSNEELMRKCRLRRRYHPFCRDGQLHIPTSYYSNLPDQSDEPAGTNDVSALPEHPASMGLKHIMYVLSIMDTYCGDDLEDDDWNAMFACDGNKYDQTVGDKEILDEEMAILHTGMRSRSRLTERVLSSLDVEITRVWALSDRVTNLATSTIHFHPADVIDMDDPANENIHNRKYGEKNYRRLVNLEERIGHARIASLLHRRRGNAQKAAELVVGFIISSAPSLGAEQYPKLPPVLSMCVLEALLSPENYVPSNVENAGDTNPEDGNKPAASQGWFQECIQHMFTTNSRADMTLLEALAYPVHTAASIWRERYFCADDRIRDVAVVELAAYERIQRLDEGMWLTNPAFEMMDIEQITKVGAEILSSAVSLLSNDGDAGKFGSSKMQVVSGISCTVSLLTLGDVDKVIQLCEQCFVGMKDCRDKGAKHSSSPFLLPACCSAYSSIMYRRWGSLKMANTSGRYTAAAFTVQDKFSPIFDLGTENVNPNDWQTIDIIIQCCVLLGDGSRLQRLANKVLPNITQTGIGQINSSMTMHQRKLMSRTLTSFIDGGEIPTVRVINLKRRPDRALDFIECAVHKEQLIVIKGPAKLRRKSLITARKNAKTLFIDPLEDEECPGDYAFDGQCNRDELEKQLLQRLDGKGTLADFVKAKWRPSDLKAFDRDARGDFELVHTSMTEKACALSHIASWTGVESTLSEIGSTSRAEYHHEWYQKKLIRMFKISGFARGAALLHENEDMDPVPVCVILEDDAVLNDRFAERLASLLEELPRDFHFCSLGYSRPKAAPMVEYSTQLGIPSCLWYLTGYVLSLKGARHLIKSLPVTGPIDSWMGLKMCSNWDNQFGDLMGVGKYITPQTKLPSRKDLAKIMKFRAFAALVPLCAQRVGTSSTPALTRGGWRDKDTDITYSGK
mmetsp:Transcript_7385/g.16744  ORF Transcript_7385/g.16744 Transcript_7385/m.16744 type:complete len:1271 (-) Transcript_7385:1309-5121(-)